jgi:glycosyltransferase involved in cell wall biosynthesis
MTAREAMAFGRPVVATRVGGLAELGPGAVLVPPGDTDELRRAVTSLLADDARRATLGREAREEVASRWAPSVAGQALVAAWERALGHDR